MVGRPGLEFNSRVTNAGMMSQKTERRGGAAFIQVEKVSDGDENGFEEVALERALIRDLISDFLCFQGATYENAATVRKGKEGLIE